MEPNSPLEARFVELVKWSEMIMAWAEEPYAAPASGDALRRRCV